ncbi:MAG: PAS domain-containing protein [Gammaproteobacteria bacterium]|nr:PAS domain-containing protein [Gammaproteobacteria bacterium]
MARRQPLLKLMRRWPRRQRTLHGRWQYRMLLALLLALALLAIGGQQLLDAAVEEEESAFVAAAAGPMLGAIDHAADQLQRGGEGWLEWELSNDWRHRQQIDSDQLAAMAADQLWLWQGQQLVAKVGEGVDVVRRQQLLQSLRAAADQPQPTRRGVIACGGRWWLFVLMTISSDDGQRWVAAVTRPLVGSQLLDSSYEIGMEVAMLAPASMVASGFILAADEMAPYGSLGVERVAERLRIRVTPPLLGEARQRLGAGGEAMFHVQAEVARDHAGRMIALGQRLLLLAALLLLGLMMAALWLSGRHLLRPLLQFSRQLRRLRDSPQIGTGLAPLLQRLLRRSFNRLSAMSEQQRFSAQVVEAIRDLILITDSDGALRHLNPAACDFLGLDLSREDAVVGTPVDLLLLVEGGCTTSLSHAIGRALAVGRTFSSEVLLRARRAPQQQVSGRMVIYPMNAVRAGSGAVVLIALSDTVCLLDPLAEASPIAAAATNR